MSGLHWGIATDESVIDLSVRADAGAPLNAECETLGCQCGERQSVIDGRPRVYEWDQVTPVFCWCPELDAWMRS